METPVVKPQGISCEAAETEAETSAAEAGETEEEALAAAAETEAETSATEDGDTEEGALAAGAETEAETLVAEVGETKKGDLAEAAGTEAETLVAEAGETDEGGLTAAAKTEEETSAPSAANVLRNNPKLSSIFDFERTDSVPTIESSTALALSPLDLIHRMGVWSHPLKNGLIQHTSKIYFAIIPEVQTQPFPVDHKSS